jgi:threonine synthase
MPTAGNAGSALAAYAARAGMRATIVMPADTPPINQAECVAYGARAFVIDGLITDAGRALREVGPGRGWFDFSTLREPYRVEGKKTMGYEIAEDLGWTMPDAIVYPAGGGTGLVGIWKAVEEMAALGWIDAKRPKMMLVQAEGCAPIVRAWRDRADHATPVEDAHTVASGLRVPAAIGDYLMLRAVRESRGTALAVSDAELLAAMHELASTEGVFAGPEAAATLAALPKLRASGAIAEGDTVLLLLTGAGMKSFEQIQVDLPRVDPRNPAAALDRA